MTLGPAQIAALAAVALLAGTVDAIAGGGGTLTVPALLFFGLPPQLALGTNKGQSVFGSFAALVRFARARMVDRSRAPIAFPLGFLGSLFGASLLLVLRPELLRPLVLALLVGVALFLTLRPPLQPRPALIPGRWQLWATAAVATVVGAYDGFFGPGTGTFLIVAFVTLLGTPLARASADSKVVNFASNLGALCLFAAHGAVIWRVALPMAVAQLAGGWLGAHLAVRGGDKLVRWIVLGMVVALVAKLGGDLLGAHAS